jgi:hypothetical protein
MRSPRRAHSSSLRFWQTYSVRAISARRRVQGCIHAGSPRSLLTSLSPNCSRAPCGDTNLRQCAAHSTARRTAPSPVRPPSSPRQLRSWPTGSNCLHYSSRPIPRDSASPRYTSPNCRERSMRMPFKRTGTVRGSPPSSKSCARSG